MITNQSPMNQNAETAQAPESKRFPDNEEKELAIGEDQSGIQYADYPDNDEDKGHTFRKRRLTCPKHHLEAAAAAAAAAFADEFSDDDDNDEDTPSGTKLKNSHDDTSKPGGSTMSLAAAAAAFAAYDDGDDTTENNGDTNISKIGEKTNEDFTSPPAAFDDDFDDSDIENDTSSHIKKKQKSGPSPQKKDNEINLEGKKKLKSRVVHAGELVRHHPIIAGGLPATVPRLYQPPFAPPTSPGEEIRHQKVDKDQSHGQGYDQHLSDHDDSEYPKWKRRHSVKPHEDEGKLPFPRHVVGTYSCHGIEPIYDDSECQPICDNNDNNETSDCQYNNSDTREDDKDEEKPSDIHQADDGARVDVLQDKNSDGSDAVNSMNDENNTEGNSIGLRTILSAKINQDRAGIAYPYGNCSNTAIFAVYDGHGQGGELVSQFALHEIQHRLERHPNFSNDIETAFKDTFQHVDFDLSKEDLIEPLYAGTTACVALVRDNKIIVANAGDSRAVLARKVGVTHTGRTTEIPDTIAKSMKSNNNDQQWDAHDLTIDQNPDLPEEQRRIEEAGGFVSPPPEEGLSARVWLDESFSMIGLAMSRSIGDHAVKTVGVVSEPVVTSHEICDDDDFMIIASDGVWEFVTSQEAVDIVSAHIYHENNPDSHCCTGGATIACQKLIEAAAAKWHDEEGDYRDDITAVVVRLHDLWTKISNDEI